MSLPFLYLIFCVLPSAAGWFGTFTILGIVTLIILGIAIAVMKSVEYDDDDKRKSAAVLSYMKKLSGFVVLLAILDVFLPDQSQIYTITGAYAVTNNAEIAKLPDNILKAANGYLEKLSAKQP
jgi:O-antigen/teichoic acid export membrane protein